MPALQRRIGARSLRPLIVAILLCGVWVARERQAVLERRAAREKLDRTAAATTPPARPLWRLVKEPAVKQGWSSSIRALLGDEPLGQIRFPRALSKAELEYLGKWFPEAAIVVAMEAPSFGRGPAQFHGAPHHGRFPPRRSKSG